MPESKPLKKGCRSTKEMESSGFRVLGLHSDLLGNPYREDSEWIGIVAERIE